MKQESLQEMRIVEDVSELVKEVVTCIESQITSCLGKSGIDFASIPRLRGIFSTTNETVTFQIFKRFSSAPVIL